MTATSERNNSSEEQASWPRNLLLRRRSKINALEPPSDRRRARSSGCLPGGRARRGSRSQAGLYIPFLLPNDLPSYAPHFGPLPSPSPRSEKEQNAIIWIWASFVTDSLRELSESTQAKRSGERRQLPRISGPRFHRENEIRICHGESVWLTRTGRFLKLIALLKKEKYWGGKHKQNKNTTSLILEKSSYCTWGPAADVSESC